MNTYKLGELITQRREKNNEEGLPISGVSKEGLIPPKQIEADTSIYNVFYFRDFIFNPARMELNSIAFNDKYEKAICSSLYEVFFVHREDIIIPEYLKLIIKQNWFIRYCEFLGQGSAREYCRFANISEINVDIPDIETQKRIVYYDKVINERINLKRKINDNLEAQALTLFEEQFADIYSSINLPEGWRKQRLDTICTVKGGKRLPADSELLDYPTNHPYIRVRDVGAFRYVCLTNQFQYIDEETHQAISRYIVDTDDIVISIVGTIGLIGKIHSTLDKANLTENCVKLTDIKDITPDYLYYTLLMKKNNKEIDLLTVGAVQAKLPMYNIQSIEIVIPPDDLMKDFQYRMDILNRQIEANTMEIQCLAELSGILLSKLSG